MKDYKKLAELLKGLTVNYPNLELITNPPSLDKSIDNSERIPKKPGFAEGITYKVFGQEHYSPTQTFGGITRTGEFYTLPNWQMKPANLSEYLKFIEQTSQLGVRILTDEDAQIVEGQGFRGTDIFMLTLALYMTGKSHSFKDRRLDHNPTEKIEIRETLCTPDRQNAAWYANKYAPETNGRVTIDSEFKKIEGRIFNCFLSDNRLPVREMPDFMLQPVLLGFDKTYQSPCVQNWEAIAYNPTPNLSTLTLVSKIMDQQPDSLREQYPILTSFFR